MSIPLTVTAAQDGVARILKFTLSADLQTSTYDGIIFSDPTESFWNLECSDTFRLGNTWYLTYSGQDDTPLFLITELALDQKALIAGKGIHIDVGILSLHKHLWFLY